MLRKLIAIDSQNADRVAKKMGFSYFPIKLFRDIVQQGEDVDVIETIATLVEFWIEPTETEKVASNTNRLKKIQDSMELQGAYVIRCPSKPSKSTIAGIKHSDDQRLMITTLSRCLKLRPDFLVFVSGDGDYAPMLWELRNEGIRTEVVADKKENFAKDLKRVAYNSIDLCQILSDLKNNNTDIDEE
ncbi:MAG: NYN domain-containing protein [Candidatus Parabeggiatoa sp.]|nr:NYN domain-containing protein [Candidatus Parabeggiatoa sp.]